MKKIIQYGLGILLAGSMALGGCTPSEGIEQKVEREIMKKIEAKPISVKVASSKRYGFLSTAVETEEGKQLLHIADWWGHSYTTAVGALIESEIQDGDDDTMTIYVEGDQIVGCEVDGIYLGQKRR